MINTNKPLNLTAEEIQDWESKDKASRKIVKVSFEADKEGETDVFFVVPMNRTTASAIADQKMKGVGVEKLNNQIVNASVLAGPIEKLQYDDPLFFGLLDELSILGEVKKRVS